LTPSKVWLAAADTWGWVSEAAALGIAIDGPVRPDPGAVLERIRDVTARWNAQAKSDLEALGVTLVTGVGSFCSPTEVQVDAGNQADGARLSADAVILASGSVPRFPPGLRPDGQRVLAPRFASGLESLPSSIVVVGGGATGSEFVYLFSRLGVDVTWVVTERGVLPMFHSEAGQFLGQVLVRRGVHLVKDKRAARIEAGEDGIVLVTQDGAQFAADAAFLAIGRRPDTARLNLAAAGLALGSLGEVEVDGFCRSSVPHIYAAGDVAGRPMLANQAAVQARVAGRHAAGTATSPYRPETVVYAIYTEPQVAQVGVWTAQDEAVQTARLSFEAGLKAHLQPYGEGFVQLACSAADGRVLGGLAVGPHAADVLAPVAVAVQMGAAIEDLAATGGANPTTGELAFLAARQATSAVVDNP
jgi:dihydrolipoamide dehydrogenase